MYSAPTACAASSSTAMPRERGELQDRVEVRRLPDEVHRNDRPSCAESGASRSPRRGCSGSPRRCRPAPGRAPQWTIVFSVATKVMGVVTTSSPGPDAEGEQRHVQARRRRGDRHGEAPADVLGEGRGEPLHLRSRRDPPRAERVRRAPRSPPRRSPAGQTAESCLVVARRLAGSTSRSPRSGPRSSPGPQRRPVPYLLWTSIFDLDGFSASGGRGTRVPVAQTLTQKRPTRIPPTTSLVQCAPR